MKAAGKTVEFVKEFIAGTYTKRQYQNYYIVKTPHVQFLMKQTEERDLVAIRDNSGHIYLPDDSLSISSYDSRILDDNAMSNPFLCLIFEGYPFKYTRLSPTSIQRAGLDTCISKWRTLDRVEVPNPTLPGGPIYLSLIEVGDQRFSIGPQMGAEDSGNGKCSLLSWADHAPEKKYTFKNPWPQYNLLPLYTNKINTVDEIRRNYATVAGNEVERSYYNNDGWVFIPTEFETVESITGKPFREAKRCRPNPYAYGLSGAQFNLNMLHRRWETTEENTQALKQCLNIREELTSTTWRDVFRVSFLRELAEEYIAYFEADDAWLLENYEIAQAGALEALLRSKVSMNLGGAIVHIHKEPNTSPLSDYVIYAKGVYLSSMGGRFVKILPAPGMASKVKGIFNADN